jgi:hypothetical protein
MEHQFTLEAGEPQATGGRGDGAARREFLKNGGIFGWKGEMYPLLDVVRSARRCARRSSRKRTCRWTGRGPCIENCRETAFRRRSRRGWKGRGCWCRAYRRRRSGLTGRRWRVRRSGFGTRSIGGGGLFHSDSIRPRSKARWHNSCMHKGRDVERLRHYVYPHCGSAVGNRDVAMQRLNDWLQGRTGPGDAVGGLWWGMRNAFRGTVGGRNFPVPLSRNPARIRDLGVGRAPVVSPVSHRERPPHFRG